MKLKTRMVACLTAIVCLLSCLGSVPVSAEVGASASPRSDDVRYAKKIVSVLVDNSGSMSNSDGRNEYAKYAMQMLMALLDSNDTLVITPMNNSAGNAVTSTSDGFEVSLGEANRNDVISKVMKDSFLGDYPSGGTPGSAVGVAVNQLTKRGLKDREHLAQSAEDLEHWLVVLTDGKFGDSSAAQVLEKYIENYPSLRTIFFAMGKDAPETAEIQPLASKYMVTPYRADSAAQITSEMQKIANQLSGRYALDASTYAVSGSSVTVDLDKLDLAFKNVSVIAQNSGVTLKSATYKGNAVTASSPCVIKINSGMGMKNGFSAVINGDPYLQGGKLVLTFDETLDAKNVTILAEPALTIVPYFEYQNGSAWERTTVQYVNANLSAKDKIRVGYEVYEQATGKIVDLKKIFGKTEEQVTYAGGSYTIGQEIPLVVGNNEIGISVSVKDGAYKLITSMRCIIEENPTYYRVEGEYAPSFDPGTLKATSVFTVFVDNKPLSKTELGKYTWAVEATTPDGGEANVTTSVGSDGKVTAVLTADMLKTGNYRIRFTVTSSLGMSRETEHVYEHRAGDLRIEQSAPDAIESGKTTAELEYKLYAGDLRLSGDTLSHYSWEAVLTSPDGTETPLTTKTAPDGRITATMTTTPHCYGVYGVRFTATAPDGTTQTVTHNVTYYPASVEILGEQIGTLTFGSTEAEFEHTVKVNGQPLTADDLSHYRWELKVVAPGGVAGDFDYDVAADGKISSSLNLVKTGFGRYQITLSVIFSEDYAEEYTFSIDFYPSSISLSLADGNGQSITQHQMLTNDRALKFELAADGTPFAFDNGLTTYKVLVDGVDVTQYVTVEGAILSYAPRAEHFGGTAAPGDRTVTVKVDCATVAALSGSVSGKFTVTETVYEVVSVDRGNKTVHRFSLKDMDSALYFRVLRDGEPLPADELQAALDSGALTVKDETGVFGWQFWLPCGKEISIDTVDGEPTLVFRVVKDWIAPFDTFAAMLMFNGDKPVTVGYNGVSGTDAIHFAPSNAWSYIWRILVILFVIHIILYIIGFFNGKCKSLPKGVLVYAYPNIGTMEEEFEMKKINWTFWDRYSWHLWRFIPHKKTLWYHQPPIKFTQAGMTLLCKDDGTLGYQFISDDFYRVSFDDNGTQAASMFDSYKGNLYKYCCGGMKPSMGERNLTGNEIRNILKRDGGDAFIPHTAVTTYSYYGTFLGDGGKMDFVVFFVRK